MKKFYGLLSILLFALMAIIPLNSSSDKISSGDVAFASTTAENVISVTQNGSSSSISLQTLSQDPSAYSSATLVLNEDITISSSWSPIGSTTNSFSGTFDGNGHTITFDGATSINGSYQGLFGYVDGALIKNLQIEGDFLISFDATEIFAGMLLGYGRNVTIENCEVVSNTSALSQQITKKITYGTLAGKLVGGSLKNVSIIASNDFSSSLSNSYTIKLGGVVGSADNVKIEKTVTFGNIKLTTSTGNDVNSRFYVGGLIGEIEDGTISDCVSGANIAVVQSSTYEFRIGAIVGNVLSMFNAGAINSTAYSGSNDAFGYMGSYSYANAETKDYVVNVADSTILKTESFYVNDFSVVESQGQTVNFGWNQSAEPWDFNSLWVVINTPSGQAVRLQSFQSFNFYLESVIDDNGMLQAQGQSEQEEVAYGEYATFTLMFKSDLNSDYYDVSEILKDGVALGFDSFEQKDGKWVSTDGSVSLSEKTVDDKRAFELEILASSSTEGRYSFRLSAVRFPIYLVAGSVSDGQINLGENGLIRYSNSSALTTNIEREVSNGTNLTIDAVANRLYSFDSWQLYYLADSETGDINYADKHWKLAENDENPMTSSSITIDFGIKDDVVTVFNKSFLLLATFKYDPYTFKISYDSNLISKVEINNQTLQTDSIELDKNENVNIKIFMNNSNTLSTEKIIQSIKNLFSSESSRLDYDTYADPTNAELTVHEFSFSTSALKTNENKTYAISLSATEGDDESQGDNTMWIIIGVVGGVVLLGLIALTIWLILRRKAVKSIKRRDDDYKKYFY